MHHHLILTRDTVQEEEKNEVSTLIDGLTVELLLHIAAEEYASALYCLNRRNVTVIPGASYLSSPVLQVKKWQVVDGRNSCW